MNIVFMGTPAFGLPALEALHAGGHSIIAVYAQPPRPAGRGQKLLKAATHQWAEQRGIPVYTPASLKTAEAQAAFAAHQADVAVVAAYGLILPQAILDAPRYGCLNIHASLLPRWRGAAPIQRAILAGDSASGVAIMQMDKGLDTGAVRLLRRLEIGAMNGGALHDALADLGAAALCAVLSALDAYPPIPQTPDGVSYAEKINKAELKIDWKKPAADLARQVRAFAPHPGAYFEYGGERFKVLEASAVPDSGAPGLLLDDRLTVACGDGALRLMHLQRSGKTVQSAAELLRGYTGFVAGAAL